VHDAGAIVMRAEAARYHRELFSRHADEYPPRIREAIEHGMRISAVDFLIAQDARRRFARDADRLARRYDALLLPTAHTSAPKGLGSTGDPYFCAPWSLAGLPAIALPSGLGEGRLPLSVQLVGSRWAEARLLAAAAWCEARIGFGGTPPL
jgi:amidase